MWQTMIDEELRFQKRRERIMILSHYSFLVGEDGSVYEGRGWDRVGAHTLNYNSRSIGISILGNFMGEYQHLRKFYSLLTISVSRIMRLLFWISSFNTFL